MTGFRFFFFFSRLSGNHDMMVGLDHVYAGVGEPSQLRATGMVVLRSV